MRQTKMSNFDLEKKWYVIDASNLVLGRLSSQIANILLGKDKPQYTPHLDLGDYVIIINAKKIKLTGNKMKQKKYYRVSRYPGNMKITTAKDLNEKNPEKIVYEAVWGMITHNRLGRKAIKKLYIYPNETHKHDAQNPSILKVNIEKKYNKPIINEK